MRVWVFSMLASALVMFTLFCLLHGFVLNDFERISIPLSNYLILFGLVYLFLAFLIVWFISLNKRKYQSPYLNFLKGALIGLVYYTVLLLCAHALSDSISFLNFQTKHLLADYSWQFVEQGVGGIVAAASLQFFGAWKKSF